jgi:hypothetical protein
MFFSTTAAIPTAAPVGRIISAVPEPTPRISRPIDPRAPSTAGGVLGHEMT